MSDEKTERRIAIVGTAPTRDAVPYDDPTLEIWHLNDAHVLNPKRADRWYDLHPIDRMYFRPPNDRPVSAGDVPAGFFVRPHNHLAFLRRQAIPVYVQDAAALGSPSARTFPREACEQLFPQYCSSPAWMVAHALVEGVTELHVYGIHLATEWEYIHQRPNFESLLTLAASRGVKIVLPRGCPLMRASHAYGYEADPDIPKVALQRKQQRIQDEIAFLVKTEKGRKWYGRKDPNYASRLAWLNAQLLDCQFGIHHCVAQRAPVGY